MNDLPQISWNDAAFNAAEQAVLQPNFLGVPLGMSLGNTLFLRLILGHQENGRRARLKNAMRFLAHGTCGIQSLGLGPPGKIPAGRILLAYLDHRAVFRRMVPSVVRALGPDACAVACLDSGLFDRLPAGVPRLVLDSAPPPPLRAWQRLAAPCLRPWYAGLRQVARDYRLPAALAECLTYEMLVQSQRLWSYSDLLERLRPSCVVVEHDRSNRGGALALAAHRLGIPTATFFHGVLTTRHAYLPLVADVGFCWGDRHRARLLALGAGERQLRMVGCSFLDRDLPTSKAAARARMQLPQAGLGMLLATSPLALPLKLRLAETFCRALEQVAGVWGAVRLHPSDCLRDYAALQRAYPAVHFHHGEAVAVDWALAAVDAVVAHNSGLACDALVKGRLAVVLDVLPLPLSNGADLVEAAGAPWARDADALGAIFARLRDDAAWRNALQRQGEIYVRDFAVAFGDGAAELMAQELRQLSRAAPHYASVKNALA